MLFRSDGFDDPPCDDVPEEPIPMEDWWPEFPWPVWADPLALDLDGDGLELVALSQSGASFDLDGDGFRQATAWLVVHARRYGIDSLRANGMRWNRTDGVWAGTETGDLTITATLA